MRTYSQTLEETGKNAARRSCEISAWVLTHFRWTVALSTRSGPDFVYFPMGRETVLTPAEWKTDEFPTFTPVRGQENGPLPPENKHDLALVPGYILR
jgi:beta-xylosidase